MKKEDLVYASIAGDIAGSTIERTFPTRVDFWELLKVGRFTDDSVLAFAVLDSVKSGKSMFEAFLEWSREYASCGFSAAFRERFVEATDPKPYVSHSTMNGALMCLAPAIAFDDENALTEAVNMSHNSAECRILANDYKRTCDLLIEGNKIEDIFEESVIKYFVKYTTFQDLMKERKWDMTAFGTLKEAYICVREAKDWINALELSLLLGGDADTRSAITGTLAASRFGLPEDVATFISRNIPIAVSNLLKRRD